MPPSSVYVLLSSNYGALYATSIFGSRCEPLALVLLGGPSIAWTMACQPKKARVALGLGSLHGDLVLAEAFLDQFAPELLDVGPGSRMRVKLGGSIENLALGSALHPPALTRPLPTRGEL